MMGKPLWISHRGYKANAVENTAAAFRAAVDLGFTCLETDLRLTRDKRIVLIHDPTLERLAGDRRRVCDLSTAELARIRFRPATLAAIKEGDRILFLDEFADQFSQCRWVFDIKPENGNEAIRALFQWAKACGMVDKIIQNAKILTWRADHEALAATCFPGVPFYARRPECWRAGLAVLSGRPKLGGIRPGRTYAIIPSFMGLSLFQESMARRFHERSAMVVAFLPPTDALARQAAAAGFNEILTNHRIVSTKPRKP